MSSQEIIELYNKKNSIRKIAKKFNKTYEEIRWILDDNNILLRPEPGNLRILTKEEFNTLIEMNNQNYSYKKIGEILNCNKDTVKNIMERNGIQKTKSTLKNHNIISDYFSNIDTEEKAYFLGLLLTDDSVRNNNIRLQLKRSDEYMIKRFRDCLNSDVVIQQDQREGKECSEVEINCPQIIQDLKKYNIVPNKTYLITDINIDLIPNHLQKHYLRGLIDGDGTIYIDKTEKYIQPVIGFCAYSEQCVASLQHFIDEVILQENNHNQIHKYNAYQCRWKGANKCNKIFHYLYDNATIYLERKYNIAKDFIE